jgi:hypothetical protein
MDIELEELLGIPLTINLNKSVFINYDNYIGFEDLFGNIIDKNKKKRCTIRYTNSTVSGGYGIIQFAKRIEHSVEKDIVVKRLIGDEKTNLFKEALLQYVSYISLKNYNLSYFVSKVYDIFYKMDTSDKKYVLHFSMEEIKGIFINTFLKNSLSPEKDFIDSFIQICVALYIFQNDINLDHRDLRYANIYIVEKAIEFPLKILNDNILYTCNFHICILDFGFACIGHKPTLINAAEGFIQNEERCFKPGRDLFQLLVSIWCKKDIRSKMSKEFIEIINSMLCYNEYDYSKITESNEDSKWPYSLTMDDSFSFIPLLPKNLLIKLIELKKNMINNI